MTQLFDGDDDFMEDEIEDYGLDDDSPSIFDDDDDDSMEDSDDEEDAETSDEGRTVYPVSPSFGSSGFDCTCYGGCLCTHYDPKGVYDTDCVYCGHSIHDHRKR